MRASDFNADRPPRPVEVTAVLGETSTLALVIDASKVTRYWAQHADDAEGVYSLYQALCEVVTGWELINDDGTPYEITPENWGALRMSFEQEQELVKEIVKASAPGAAEGNASANTSDTPGTDSTSLPASRPNGQVPSVSRPPSAAVPTR